MHVPPATSREVISLLRYRHRLVRMRTMLKNSLQAIALSHRVRIGPRLFSVRGRQQLEALRLTGAQALQRKQCTEMILALTERIEDTERELAGRAEQDRRVERLRTHPGVGILTALAFVHLLEPVTRFERAGKLRPTAVWTLKSTPAGRPSATVTSPNRATRSCATCWWKPPTSLCAAPETRSCGDSIFAC